MSEAARTPSFHLPDAALFDYVAGRSSDAAALAAACHLTLCGTCQTRVQALEGAAGRQLAQATTMALGDGALDRVLARLDEQARPLPAPEPANDLDLDVALPRPLLERLPRQGRPRWRWLVPGIRAIELPVSGVGPGTVVRLVRLSPGTVIPRHDHGGPEYTVVFSGGLRDEHETWHRGDLAIRNPGDCHRQQVLPGEDCVALAVNEGEMLPLSWMARVVKTLARA